ncbi:dihydrodipicolinate reductase [Pseudooceanicola antarcticus]|nr:dihydrodipicolinate reductase [Pseudooceanicola antarcticus]
MSLLSTIPAPAGAEDFLPIETRADFLDLVDGAKLTTLGMTLYIRSDGRITGTAYGARLRGEWEWSDAYFCRTLSWGGQNLPLNCHSVTLLSRTLRMTEQEGQGTFVDFFLQN